MPICAGWFLLAVFVRNEIPRAFLVVFFHGHLLPWEDDEEGFDDAFKKHPWPLFHVSSFCTEMVRFDVLWVIPLTQHYTQKLPKVNNSPPSTVKKAQKCGIVVPCHLD